MNIAALLRLSGRVAPARVGTVQPQPASAQIKGATEGCYALRISDTEYHGGAPGISSTGLKKILRSPAHYLAYLRDKDNDTAARRFGRAAHAWLLENHLFNSKFAVWRNGARRGRAYGEFEVMHQGKDILTEEEMLRVQGCANALLENPDFPLRAFLEGARDATGQIVEPPAETEFSIFWTDEETGVQCKVRLDALRLASPVLAFDLKTTDDAREPAFTRQMMQLDYDLQAAFYTEGVRRFTGQACPFMFGAVEVDAPHGNNFFILGPDSDMMANGRKKMRHALQLKAQCDRSGRYPGYQSGGIREPQLQPWMAFEAPEAIDFKAAA